MPISQLFSNPLAFLLRLLFLLPVILISLTLHELAHGFIAYKLGDSTAKYMGRLSLNPLHHVDPFGLIALLFVGFGWAKPVQVDPRNLRKPKRDMALVSLAGPVTNFLLAFIGMFFYYAILYFSSDVTILTLQEFFSTGKISGEVTVWGVLAMFFTFFISVNIGLGIFNLIPIPPLDGSKILYSFLPNRVLYRILPYERYAGIALMLLLVFGVLDAPLFYLQDLVAQAFSALPRLIFFGGGA